MTYPMIDPATGQPMVGMPMAPQMPQPPAPAPYPQQPMSYPPQGYGQPYPAPPVQQPLAQGSLDAFYNQPSTGGGKSLAFDVIGRSYVGIVTRPLTAADVAQQTDTNNRPLVFRDGSPKFVMKVPLQMQPTQDRPDGLGTWYVKGADRDELNRAMAEAGAPAGPPEAGAVIQITYVSDKANGPGMNPSKVKQVRYQRPQGATAVPAPVAEQQQTPQPVTPPAPPVTPPAPPVTPAAPVAAPVAAQPLPAPPGLDPAQAALLAQMTGQAAPPAA
ncbi:hypothetical protein [Labedaea rhizosphaerae]|uniref:Uncharacterized protein n=1 Tax=Labedaea rhizosphaerae TaxID=598644 RepID=A0A4R6SF04_LABRH|nr:hypothetical protein [Labedaea rhizosphaerae]TDP97666.1 hypothetical protein EV186_103630 [Labedaea rhizosphaerae]